MLKNDDLPRERPRWVLKWTASCEQSDCVLKCTTTCEIRKQILVKCGNERTVFRHWCLEANSVSSGRTVFVVDCIINGLTGTTYCGCTVLLASHRSLTLHRPDYTRMLEIQQYKRKTHGFRTFSCFGPHIWNSLPQDLRHCSTLSSFKAKLKTFLFSQYFHPN